MCVQYLGRYRNGVTIYWKPETPHIIEWAYCDGRRCKNDEPGFRDLLAQYNRDTTCYGMGVF